ncbi:MAG: hypothetical protein FWE32_02595 [Oscillospiraceae bacterium]|nr:hypothetical protein [Oscillospiraceae bacterium]
MNTNRRIIFGILILIILISGILIGRPGRNTHDETGSVSILFVGNSHVRTGDVPGQLQTLLRMHGIEMTYVDVSRNGANLDGALRESAIREMQNTNFDYVVMQARGRSIRPTNDIDGFLDDVRVFSEQIREYGAEPVLYSPAWANINGRPDEELQNILTQAHRRAADENGIILVNAGDAWVYAYRAIPGVSLYARDRIHANHAGAFLSACVFAATLFDLRVEDIPTGSLIDNLPILNILTLAGFIAVALIVIYRLVNKQPLRLKNPLMVVISLALLQVMSFFPHIFIFMEGGGRLYRGGHAIALAQAAWNFVSS